MTSTRSRPLLFVDVDGVLNLWQPPFPADVIEHAWFPEEDPVRLRPVHGRWLHDLGRAFDLVWATAWPAQDRALIVDALALPEFAGSVALPAPPFPPSAKVPAIASYAGERPLVWIDDQITDAARRWAVERQAATLLVPVDSSRGLLRSHAESISEWARDQRSIPSEG